ncbi:MAG: hypothetical protein OEY89_12120 [Gammaproteobacteria bacterium]|nr:hypothetical protein [Gammaproteobacteria bacterium]
MIIPVILSGGTGARLWLLFRALRPKQLLSQIIEVAIVLELFRHNTAPAIVISAMNAEEINDEAVISGLPVDHGVIK